MSDPNLSYKNSAAGKNFNRLNVSNSKVSFILVIKLVTKFQKILGDESHLIKRVKSTEIKDTVHQ